MGGMLKFVARAPSPAFLWNKVSTEQPAVHSIISPPVNSLSF